MQSQLNYIESFNNPQIVYSMILEKITDLYDKYAPKAVKNRRNTNLQKQSDTKIISAVIWGTMQGYATQSQLYRGIRSTLFPNDFPERSRFCRICQNLAFTVNVIRYFFIKSLPIGTELVIIDSLPSPMCKPIRNHRAKILHEVANIGYNSTKKMHYYGVKLSFFVTDSGYPLDYVVSAASIHDVRLVATLAQATPVKKIIGDKGYLSLPLKEELKKIGITLTTPLRKNMAGAEKIDDSLLRKRRKRVETVFSSLESLGIEAFKSRSLLTFKFRLETILLTYSLMLERAQQYLAGTLKYSFGRF